MNPQYYQPLSAALHAPVSVANAQAQPQFIAYGSHARDAPAAGTPNQQHREEEEEEEEDDEEIVEEELDHHDAHQGPSTHSSPRPPPPPTAQSSSGFTGPGGATISHQFNTIPAQDHPNQSSTDADGAEKRKPGRPRGSRNRKPRAAPGTASTPTTSSKAPVNSQHPGFYQYPPAPAHAQNQQFYEFQWRALNLCSEFYNAAEELVKAASPVVIAQCYQMGPTTKIDPLAMISEAKRVCDNLLANPSQLVGTPPPPPAPMYSQVPAYSTMPPPPPGNAQGQPAGPSSGPVPMITNPQSFVMSLGATAPQGHPQPYYPPMYAQPGSRYPTTPYYSYAPGTYYAPPAQPQPQSQPQSQSVSAAPATSQPANSANNTASPPSASAAGQSASAPPATGTLSTFNAATGNAAPGGQQGTWSEEETERLRKLAEQSREIGGAQSKGEIEWDWVVHQWGNSRTRHQILLKATSMGLKESTTRGTKRRRENENAAPESASSANPPHSSPPIQPHPQVQQQQAPPPQQQQQQPPVPTQASPTQSPTTIPSSRPATTTPTIAPNRISSGPTPTSATTPSTSNMPWPMPTVAANTPSPVMAHTQTENQRSATNYYRPRPPGQQQPYTGTSPVVQAARPPSSHGSATTGAMHEYMFRPNGSQQQGAAAPRRPNGI